MLCMVLGGDQDVSISLDITESQVHKGANITLNCRIKGIGPGEIIYWSKVSPINVLGNNQLKVIIWAL